MSGVSNGQLANQTTFNNAFLVKNADEVMPRKLNFTDVDAVSGPSIINIQRNVNALASALGISTNQAFDVLITWANTVVGSTSSTSVAKVEALVERFTNATGHIHDGTDGEGPQVSATNLAQFNNFWGIYQMVQFVGAAGTSDDVTASFIGRAAGGGTSVAGVITAPPSNKVYLIDESNGTFVEDGVGRRVFGRITFAAGVWTLSYFVVIAGVETAHSMTSTDIDIFFIEVFNSENRPTVGSDPGSFGTVDVTADVVDASLTQRGLVSIGAQTFGGNKTFNEDLIAEGNFKLLPLVDSTTTGANQTLDSLDRPAILLTNVSLVSIEMIDEQSAGKVLFLVNRTGNSIDILNDTGATAAQRILTGTGAALTIDEDSAIIVIYDDNALRWQVVGGSGGGASFPNQTANTVFSGPSAGGPAAPTFRALVSDDIPTLDVVAKTTGTLLINRGGTGQTSANAALNALLPTQTGNAGRFLTTNATNSAWTAPAYISSVFTSSGTFTTPADSTTNTIYEYEIVGGGGGGGGAGGDGGAGGGGAGGYVKGRFSVIAPSTGITITIGASGAGGNSSGTNGGAGGTSTIGAPVSVSGNGGDGGIGVNAATGAAGGSGGGTAGGGDLTIIGGNGGMGSYGSSGAILLGGRGGNAAAYGIGAQQAGGLLGNSSDGLGASGHGGGGSGARGAATGGAGSAGVIIITRVTI